MSCGAPEGLAVPTPLVTSISSNKNIDIKFSAHAAFL